MIVIGPLGVVIPTPTALMVFMLKLGSNKHKDINFFFQVGLGDYGDVCALFVEKINELDGFALSRASVPFYYADRITSYI